MLEHLNPQPQSPSRVVVLGAAGFVGRTTVAAFEGDDTPVLSATEKATVSYNILDMEFAALAAQRDAQERAIKSLGKDIVVRLAVFFNRQK